MKRLSEIQGTKAPRFVCPHFKEFVVDFNGTGMKVKEINQALLSKKIFGGKDLSSEFPDLGESALYCVTEIHTKEDLDCLTQAISEVVSPNRKN